MYGLIGCSFVAFGLVARRRRPDSRAGMLMTATGFSFFVAPVVAQWRVVSPAGAGTTVTAELPCG